MYVTVQSSLLIILRLPGVCWLEDPRGPPGGAAEQRAPWPGVQRDGTSSASLTSFPLHGGVGSEQNLQVIPEIHVHSNHSVDNASGAVSQGGNSTTVETPGLMEHGSGADGVRLPSYHQERSSLSPTSSPGWAPKRWRVPLVFWTRTSPLRTRCARAIGLSR